VNQLAQSTRYAPIAAPGSAQQRISPLECATDEERSIFKEIEHRLALQRALTKPVVEAK